MRKTFRYRIYPTPRQQTILDGQLALCAELYNAGLQERKEAWQRERKSISYFDQTVQLTQVKSVRDDVAGVNCAVLENVLKRVDLAFKGYFRRVKDGGKPGYPRFRSAARYNSMTFRNIGKALSGNKLRLSRVGNVKIKLHRSIEGKVKTLTVKREAGRWFALFSVVCQTQLLPESSAATGIDVGISAFATFSDGRAVENPRYYESAQTRLRVAQRKVARRKKVSHRRRKAIRLLQRAHVAISNQRSDFHHKLSRTVVNTFGLIGVENLNIKGLARTRLSKQIHDAGWAQFLNMLAHKAEEAGRVFVQVNPSGTSQTCTCGASVPKTLSQRWHECLSCGLSAARDHVSAQIILGRAVRLQALTSPVAECVA